MADPFATAEQVAAVFRPLTTAEQAIVTARLEQASRLLRKHFPDIDARITSGSLDADLAADAAVNMVLRVIRVPGALSGAGNIRSETTGPFRRDFVTTSDGDASMEVEVTAAEVALLAPTPVGGRRKPAGTIRVQAGLAPAPMYQGRLGETDVLLW